jgi:hypothetical protein
LTPRCEEWLPGGGFMSSRFYLDVENDDAFCLLEE